MQCCMHKQHGAEDEDDEPTADMSPGRAFFFLNASREKCQASRAQYSGTP